MLYLTCTTITSVDLAQYGVALAEDWVSVECGTSTKMRHSRDFQSKDMQIQVETASVLS